MADIEVEDVEQVHEDAPAETNEADEDLNAMFDLSKKKKKKKKEVSN